MGPGHALGGVMNHPRCGFAAPPRGGAADDPAKPGRGGRAMGRSRASHGAFGAMGYRITE